MHNAIAGLTMGDGPDVLVVASRVSAFLIEDVVFRTREERRVNDFRSHRAGDLMRRKWAEMDAADRAFEDEYTRLSKEGIPPSPELRQRFDKTVLETIYK